MNSLTAKALTVFAKNLIIISLTLFLAAWSVDFWEAWVFLPSFFIPQLMMIIYFRKTTPDFLERRLRSGPTAETRAPQKAVMLLVNFSWGLMVLVAGIDHRLNWSHVSVFLVIIANVSVLLGFSIQFLAFKENRFASAVVAIVSGQQVISTGPYAVVRHPMYAGAFVVSFFTPIALGSWWGLPFTLVWLTAISLRILDEEKLLRQNLPAYEAYFQKCQYRLIPTIW